MADDANDRQEFSFMVLSSVRYAMRARSYAPGLVIRYTRRHWQEIDSPTRSCILRDVEEAVQRNAIDHVHHAETWRSFMEWMRTQIADEQSGWKAKS